MIIKKLKPTKRFAKDYKKLDIEIKKQATKQLKLFLRNAEHSSLNIKKMKGSQYIWEGRVNKSYRFTFQLDGQNCILRRIGTHDVLQKP